MASASLEAVVEVGPFPECCLAVCASGCNLHGERVEDALTRAGL